MWIVKKLGENKYRRYSPIQRRFLGNEMTYEEIITYCKSRPTDMFARNFLTFVGAIADITDNKKPND